MSQPYQSNTRKILKAAPLGPKTFLVPFLHLANAGSSRTASRERKRGGSYTKQCDEERWLHWKCLQWRPIQEKMWDEPTPIGLLESKVEEVTELFNMKPDATGKLGASYRMKIRARWYKYATGFRGIWWQSIRDYQTVGHKNAYTNFATLWFGFVSLNMFDFLMPKKSTR